MSYIKLHRKILNWEWYQDANTVRLFLHLIINANYESKRWQGMEIKPGQLVTGRIKLASELKLSEQEIRTSLNKLKSTSEITIISTSKYSVITICKWEDYQAKFYDNQPTDQPTYQLSSNQQSTTTKEIKEIKEVKKDNISAIFEEFRVKYPGAKRGLKTELDLFLKKNNPEIVSLLLPALEKEIAHREKLKASNEFLPNYKNLSTWINQKCWETEYPEVKPVLIPEQFTTKTQTVSEFDFDSLNSQRLAVVQNHK